jgi:hypothetical protein
LGLRELEQEGMVCWGKNCDTRDKSRVYEAEEDIGT